MRGVSYFDILFITMKWCTLSQLILDQGYQDKKLRNHIEREFDQSASNSKPGIQGVLPTDKFLTPGVTPSENIVSNQLMLKAITTVRKNRKISAPYPKLPSYLKVCPYCSQELVWHAISTHIRDFHRDKWVISEDSIATWDHYTEILINENTDLTPSKTQRRQFCQCQSCQGWKLSVSFCGRQLTRQQFHALRQQVLQKENQQQEAQNAATIAQARLQDLQPSSGDLMTQSVATPVAARPMNLPQIRAALSRLGVTNSQQIQPLQKQLLQRKEHQPEGIIRKRGVDRCGKI